MKNQEKKVVNISKFDFNDYFYENCYLYPEEYCFYRNILIFFLFSSISVVALKKYVVFRRKTNDINR